MCNSDGSVNQLCDKSSGNCECLPFVDGLKCSKCQDGYYGFPECQGTHIIRLEDEQSITDFKNLSNIYIICYIVFTVTYSSIIITCDIMGTIFIAFTS